MSLLDKYAIYKKGFVGNNVSIKMQRFFKTNPTEEQLLLIQEMEDQNGVYYGILMLLGVLFGLLTGYALAHIEIALEMIKKTITTGSIL